MEVEAEFGVYFPPQEDVDGVFEGKGVFSKLQLVFHHLSLSLSLSLSLNLNNVGFLREFIG